MSDGIISRFGGLKQSTSQKVSRGPVRSPYGGGRSVRSGSGGRKPEADAASRRPSRYTYKSVHTDPIQTLEPKKDLRVYTDAERRDYKRRQQEVARQKSAVARRWIAGYVADIKRAEPDRRVSMPSIVYCGNPLWRQDRPEAPRTASVIYDGRTDQVDYERQNCHNIWCCPVCSQKDMYKRSMMLAAGMRRAASIGLRMLFLTFTIPHDARETTGEVLANLVAAYRDFGHQRSVIGVKRKYGYVGAVKATDFTFNPVMCDGIREWNAHAHYHCVWFFDTEEDPGALARAVKSTFLDEWARCQQKLTGRSLNLGHGFDVEVIDLPDGDDEQAAKVAEYAAKTVSLYVGKSASGKGSMMPLDFLTPPAGCEGHLGSRVCCSTSSTQRRHTSGASRLARCPRCSSTFSTGTMTQGSRWRRLSPPTTSIGRRRWHGSLWRRSSPRVRRTITTPTTVPQGLHLSFRASIASPSHGTSATIWRTGVGLRSSGNTSAARSGSTLTSSRKHRPRLI